MIRVGIIALCAAPALCSATDHNNLESGRPTAVDDAYAIAYRSTELQLGVSGTSAGRGATFGVVAEYAVGFALNRQLSVSFSPEWHPGRQVAGDIELHYFENVRREIGDSPAFGYGIGLGLPVGRSDGQARINARAAFTKSLAGLDKLHLNFDIDHEERITFGGVLGYSVPLGHPRRFDQTLVAEAGIEGIGNKSRMWAGAGLRRQVSPVAVLDFGFRAGQGHGIRAVFGYSRSY